MSSGQHSTLKQNCLQGCKSMVQGERLSAVAKRRRLDGSVSPYPSTPQPLTETNSALSSQGSKPTKSIETKNNTNSFNSLATSKLVSFHSVRSIASVDEQRVRISVLKGQDCLIRGRFLLWVRHGRIVLLGAAIDSSSSVQRVYHPEDEDIPAIVCMSDDAEFQLESDSGSAIWSTGLAPPMYHWYIPGEEHVQTLSFVPDGVELYRRPLQESVDNCNFDAFSMRSLRSMVEVLTSTKSRMADAQRILLCGKRHPAIAKVSKGLVNHLLTNQRSSGGFQATSGVLVLDIDLHTPSFSPPSTISLVYVNKPICRPFYDVLMTPEAGVHVLAMQYVGKATSTFETKSSFKNLLKRLDEECRARGPVHVVINCWDLVDHHLTNFLDDLKHLDLLLNVFFFGDENPSHPEYEAALTKKWQHPLHRVCCTSAIMPTPTALRRATLRSYLSHVGFNAHDPNQLKAKTACMSNLILLRYGPDRQNAHISALHFPGDNTRAADITSRLLGTRVAIILYPSTSISGVQDPFEQAIEFTSNESYNSGQLTGSNQQRNPGSIVVHRTEAEGIPLAQRWSSTNDFVLVDNECIGLGTVVHINVSQHCIHIATPIPPATLHTYLAQGHQFQVVVCKD